jgi:CYTH domain-containing protein
MEIERKFLLPHLPIEVQALTPITIVQGYVFVAPGELRIREEGGVHSVLTVKDDGNLARREWITTVPRWVFDLLWRQTEGRRVRKLRRIIKTDTHTLEVDEYLGELAGLFVLEVEFADEASALEFDLPWWAESALEITSVAGYKNKNLATYGVPAIERENG